MNCRLIAFLISFSSPNLIYMKNLLVYTFIISALSLTFSCSTTENESPEVNNLESRIDSLVQPYLDSNQVAGISIGIVQGDEQLMRKTYGFADVEFEVPLPLDASFEIGSVTKQFTSVGILQLAEKDSLDLNDSFTDYIDFDTGGRQITIEQLMNHTSGIKGYTEMRSFGGIAPFELERDTLLRLVENEEFDFEPGEQMIYNNTAFYILGLIIEKVSGMSYEDYVRENIFEPAGMNDSYYCSNSAIRRNRAHGYGMSRDGLVRSAYLDHTWPYAAGSLCSTVEDLLQWNKVLHTTNKILNESSYEKLIAPARLGDGTPLRYGMGLALTNYNGTPIISHGGGIPGFLSDSRYFPEEDLTIVTLVNTTGPVAPAEVSMFAASIILGEPLEEDQPDPGNLARLAGHYEGSGRGQSTSFDLEADDNMLIRVSDNGGDTLKYLGDNRWSVGNTYYNFHETDNEITGLELDNVYGYYKLYKVE